MRQVFSSPRLANVEGIASATARKRFTPSKLLPRPQSDPPMVYGVSPAYVDIANLALVSGRFFDDRETAGAAPVAVLGEAAAASLFGADDPIGRRRESPGLPLDRGYRDAFAAIERDPNQLLAVAERDVRIVGVLQLSFIPGLTHRGMRRGR